MTARKVTTPVASLVPRWDHEQQQEHDFCNLLQEFQWAVERQDRMMMEYCDFELKRMFRDRRLFRPEAMPGQSSYWRGV